MKEVSYFCIDCEKTWDEKINDESLSDVFCPNCKSGDTLKLKEVKIEYCEDVDKHRAQVGKVFSFGSTKTEAVFNLRQELNDLSAQLLLCNISLMKYGEKS